MIIVATAFVFVCSDSASEPPIPAFMHFATDWRRSLLRTLCLCLSCNNKCVTRTCELRLPSIRTRSPHLNGTLSRIWQAFQLEQLYQLAQIPNDKPILISRLAEACGSRTRTAY